MIKKIRTKIVLFFSAVTVLLVLFFLFFFIDLVRDIHLGIIKREMSEKSRLIEVLFQEEHGRYFFSKSGLGDITRRLSTIMDLRISIIDLNGKVIADSSHDVDTLDNHFYRTEVQQSLKNGTGESIRYSNSLKRDMLYYARKSDGHIIRLSKDIEEIDHSIMKARRIIFLLGGIMIVSGFVINLIISRQLTRPINETIDFAADFSKGNLARRIINYSDDEIGMLQKSLNRLADILQEKVTTLVIERQKLDTTIQSINDGIAVIDTGRKVTIANKALSTLLDVRTQPEGRSYYEVIRSSALNSQIDRALSHGEYEAVEVEMVNGRTCDVFINPISEEGRLQGILLVLHDITERKKIVRIKTELVGNLSHELKTPITILRGYMETALEHSDDRETTRGLIEKALVNLERQNSIINDMLKLNMLETSPAFATEDVNLADSIGGCIESLQPKLGEKRISLTENIASLPGTVKANRFLAEEIFFNLIDNAINYNRFGGSIVISAESLPGKVLLSVSDTGIGIPAGHIDRIFERFYRVNKGRSRVSGGTGLGLSIVKHALDLLHWKINVVSGDGGSTFTVEIPFLS